MDSHSVRPIPGRESVTGGGWWVVGERATEKRARIVPVMLLHVAFVLIGCPATYMCVCIIYITLGVGTRTGCFRVSLSWMAAGRLLGKEKGTVNI